MAGADNMQATCYLLHWHPVRCLMEYVRDFALSSKTTSVHMCTRCMSMMSPSKRLTICLLTLYNIIPEIRTAADEHTSHPTHSLVNVAGYL